MEGVSGDGVQGSKPQGDRTGQGQGQDKGTGGRTGDRKMGGLNRHLAAYLVSRTCTAAAASTRLLPSSSTTMPCSAETSAPVICAGRVRISWTGQAAINEWVHTMTFGAHNVHTCPNPPRSHMPTPASFIPARTHTVHTCQHPTPFTLAAAAPPTTHPEPHRSHTCSGSASDSSPTPSGASAKRLPPAATTSLAASAAPPAADAGAEEGAGLSTRSMMGSLERKPLALAMPYRWYLGCGGCGGVGGSGGGADGVGVVASLSKSFGCRTGCASGDGGRG